MSSSEIAFLALGLILGAALGAALLRAVRARPAPRREVRLTIAPNSIGARRSATLSDPTGAGTEASPPGSPGDAARPDRDDPVPGTVAGMGPEPLVPVPPMRTYVSSDPPPVPAGAVVVPVAGGASASTLTGIPPTAYRSPGRDAMPASEERSGVAIAVAGGPAPSTRSRASGPPVVVGLGRPAPAWQVRARSSQPEARPTLALAAVGIPVARATLPIEPPPEPPRATASETASEPPRATASSPASEPPRATASDPASPGSPATVSLAGAVDPCSAARAAAEERCAAAVDAREAARVAVDAMRDAQREFDVLRDRLDTARATSDPRALAAAKAELHARFREDSREAVTPDETEAAARGWLKGIDRANADVRAALRLIATATVELQDQQQKLERLAPGADAARITAERAEQECRAGREELARCEELAIASVEPPAAKAAQPPATAWPTEPDQPPDRRAPEAPADNLAELPLIIRMLRGDRAARDRVVAALAGDEPASVATWQLRISALLDAIVARAIEADYLDLPDDDPFWLLFKERERREIVGALSSLGYRYDGLGGFADGRVPAARDLSLAVGYSGLDPMRIRIWPREAELAALYARASVAADAWLADEADDLDLGAVIDALGPRADDLGELWDAWGRIRPLLLATA